jgi:hypothetical protein
VYPAHSNAISCGKVAFYADFMRFPVRYPLKIGINWGFSAGRAPQ